MAKKRLDLDAIASKLQETSSDAGKGSRKSSPAPPIPSTVDALSRSPSSKIAGSLLRVKTENCVMWAFADRDNEGLGQEELIELSSSIQKNGQLVPAIARRLTDAERAKRGLGADISFEIIAGRRRFEAVKLAGIELLINLRNVDDREAFTLMLAENDDREDLKAFTRAMSFKEALDKGIYQSQSELLHSQQGEASSKRYSKAHISRMVTAAQLSSRKWLWDKLNEFQVADIPITMAYRLETMLEGDTKAEKAAKQALPKIAASNVGGLLKELVTAIETVEPAKDQPTKVSFSVGDFDVKVGRKGKQATIDLPVALVGKDNIEDFLVALRQHFLGLSD